MRIGEEHGGWKLITSQLNFERVALGPAGGLFRHLSNVTRWANETEIAGSVGSRVADLEWVRVHLGRVRAKAEVARLFNWRTAWLQEQGQLNAGTASAMKVYGTELTIEVLRLLMEVVGSAASLQSGSPGAQLHGDLERAYRTAIVGTFGGGVNEVQREIVASAALGSPRVPR
jgi:alkylation response protein AidB-like acyl-CoA dehydrogenase